MDVVEKMKDTIQESFDHIRKALDFREKLLIRQVQVLHQNQVASHLAKEIHFIPENEVNLLHMIRIFGKFNINKFNVHSDFLSNEDYICPQNDHVWMNKQLIETTTVPVVPDSPGTAARKDLLLVDNNANNINESLINLILNESKELIEKSSHTFRVQRTREMDGQTKERHGNKKLHIGGVGDAPAAVTRPLLHDNKVLPKSGKSNFSAPTKRTTITTTEDGDNKTELNHPKKKFASLKNISNLTLNSGTLNLRNITNLTINTSCTNTRPRPTAITSAAADYDVQAVACDFYNRLINENKLLNQQKKGKQQINHNQNDDEMNISPTPSVETASTSFKEFSSGMERKLMGRMENWSEGEAKDANGNVIGERPKQIQLWLKQIINEPELEPMPNTEFLEFSCIKNP